MLEQEGRLGSGSPGTRRSEAGQHELRPDFEGIGGNHFGIGKPLIGGVRGGRYTWSPTMSTVRGETGEEGK
jgi:hypothetical protein